MFSRSSLLKTVLFLLFILVVLSPFNFDRKIEVFIVLLGIILLIVFYILYLPNETEAMNQQMLELELIAFNLKNQLDDVLTSLGVPLVIIDNNLNILFSNLAFQQTFDQSIKQFSHQNRQLINTAIRTSGNTRQNIYINHREYLMISSHLTYNSQQSTLLLFNDITSLLEAQKAQKRFIADASHELKTPITAIKGMSELLTTHTVDDETQTEFLSQIHKEANRLQKIVSDLLEISKLSSNRLIIHPSTFDFSSLVKEVYFSLRSFFLEKNLQFVYDFKPVTVFLDYERMHQVLTNLLTNAINYSDKGKIELQVIQKDKQLIIVLKDEGIGIDEDHLPYLFDRFYRIDEARDRQLGGSGLGLSIVDEIVKAHDGTISVDSELNKGTQVTIKIN